MPTKSPSLSGVASKVDTYRLLRSSPVIAGESCGRHVTAKRNAIFRGSNMQNRSAQRARSRAQSPKYLLFRAAANFRAIKRTYEQQQGGRLGRLRLARLRRRPHQDRSTRFALLTPSSPSASPALVQSLERVAGYLAPYSITSSARPSTESGTMRPSALAVLRFMISSTFVTCWTGRLPGFSPWRIFPT